MLFEMSKLTGGDRYRLLTATVTPRPIAWVTTMSAAGVLNAAPFSAFNMVGHSPPMLVMGMQPREGGQYKDTCANIIETGELVVNLVSQSDAETMNNTSADSDPQFDEIAAFDIATLASSFVKPPRIATSPVSFECKTFQIIQPSEDQTIILAEVVATHVRDDLVLDADRIHLDNPGMQLIGRAQGPGWYVRATDRFQMLPPGLLPRGA